MSGGSGAGWTTWALYEIEPLPFKTLERKLAVYLPRSPDEEAVGIVIEVGDESISEAQVADLRKQVHDLAESFRGSEQESPVVLLDVHPEMAMAEFLKILDVPHLEGFHEIAFADTTGTVPPPGVRVNGISLAEIDDVTALPDPIHRSALERVMVMGGAPFAMQRLRRLREERREK